MATKRRSPNHTRRVCVDTGGTFTDIVELSVGELEIRKVLSTPSRPERAVLLGLEAGGGASAGGRLVHGSTVGLNAILTGRGARIAFVTNAGFEDLIEIARQNRPELYARSVPPRRTLVPRSLRFGVKERRLASGVREAIASDEELATLCARLQQARVDAVAIGLLHAHEHPEDEERIARALAPLGVPITCSAALLRRHREYERFSTAVMNAFVGPVVSSYLERLTSGAAPMEVHLVRNEGGTLPADDVLAQPARTLFSGPAGGAIAARFWAERAGHGVGIGFDMGGTSADVALCGGDADVTSEAELAGHALALPTFPIASVGTGGGSIAYRDAGGALRVGPRSAGAEPGPACYGRGEEPTVTDAHLLLGRLPSSGLLGGDFALRPERARDALARLGRELGRTPEELAHAILELADLQMARPLRAFTLGRGLDPADCCLVAFGGAGGLHGARLAQRVGFGLVLVPPDPGVLSAVGMLLTGPVVEVERAWLERLERAPARGLANAARELAREAQAAARARHGTAQRHELFASVRYVGHRTELWVPADAAAPESFEAAFEARFGFRQQLPIEALRLRVRLCFEEPDPGNIERLFAERLARHQRSIERRGRQPLGNGGLEGIARAELTIGRWQRGPFAILDYSGTTIVEEGWRARLEPSGAVRLQRI